MHKMQNVDSNGPITIVIATTIRTVRYTRLQGIDTITKARTVPIRHVAGESILRPVPPPVQHLAPPPDQRLAQLVPSQRAAKAAKVASAREIAKDTSSAVYVSWMKRKNGGSRSIIISYN